MAEGLLRAMAGDRFEVTSAGTQPSSVRHEAITVMNELGVDLTSHRSKHLHEFSGQSFDYVITVCDNARESCPVFPSTTRRIHWSVEDPAAAQGSEQDRLAAFRKARDELAGLLRGFAEYER